MFAVVAMGYLEKLAKELFQDKKLEEEARALKELHRIAKRVYLVFPLPYPWILIRVVFLPAGAIWPFVKGIGSR